MNNYAERHYLTDDRDQNNRFELVVMHAPNGDYYIGSVPEGSVFTTGVRICTSGGASSKNPKLARAIYEVFQALGGWEQDLSDPPRLKK
jgi:hypothetical protein